MREGAGGTVSVCVKVMNIRQECVSVTFKYVLLRLHVLQNTWPHERQWCFLLVMENLQIKGEREREREREERRK